MQSAATSHKELIVPWWTDAILKDYETDYFGVTAGLGSGKSHNCGFILTDRLLENPECPRMVAAINLFKLIKTVLIPHIEASLKIRGYKKGKHYRIYTSANDPRVVWIPTGQEILLMTLENPDGIVGFESGFTWVSEAGFIREESFNNITNRTRNHVVMAGNKAQMLWEGTTEGMRNKYAKTFNQTEKRPFKLLTPKTYERIETVQETGLQFRYKRFRLSSFDNPVMGKRIGSQNLQTYKGQENKIRSRVYGYFVPLEEGQVFDSYNPRLHDIPRAEAEPDPALDILFTWDFNNNPLAWLTAQVVRDDNYESKLIFQHESCGKNNDLTSAVAEFAKRYPPVEFKDSRILLYGDSSGHAQHTRKLTEYQEIADELKKHGYRYIAVEALRYNPLEPDTVSALNQGFKTDFIRVANDLPQFKNSLLETQWSPKGLRKIHKPDGDTWTHYADAAKYMLYVLFVSVKNKIVQAR